MTRAAATLALGVIAALGGAADGDPAVTRIDIDYDYAGFHSRQAHYTVTWTAAGGYRVGDRAIDSNAVDAVVAALGDLRPSDGLRHCISHTDDYPHFRLALAGARAVTIDSDSNCAQHVPWNVVEGGALFAQFTGRLDRPVRALLAAIEPGQWPTGDPTDEDLYAAPRISMGAVGEGARAPETLPVGVHASPSVAAACAASLAASADARKLFGEPIQVDELELSCKIGSLCDTVDARARVRWAHAHVTVELACTAGAIDGTALPPQLVTLRGLLATKPISVVVALAGGAARLAASYEGWTVDPRTGGVPHVLYETHGGWFELDYKSTVAPNPALWRQLGIDGTADMRPNGAGWWEFNITLDRHGKRTTPPAP